MGNRIARNHRPDDISSYLEEFDFFKGLTQKIADGENILMQDGVDFERPSRTRLLNKYAKTR